MKILKYLAILLLSISCDQPNEISTSSWDDDYYPPVLMEDKIDSTGIIDLDFDEAVELKPEALRASESVKPKIINQRGKKIKIDAREGSKPGKAYSIEARVKDQTGNETHLVLPYYAPNPRLPQIIINELCTKISTKNRDAVELKVLSDGNLQGITLFLGSRDEYEALYIFGDIEVKAGQFIIVHCKGEGLPIEKNELDDWTISGGKNSSPTALDVWVKDAPGLPDSKGVIVLAANPLGQVLDAIFYSAAETSTAYEGFGTKKLLDRVKFLDKEKSWDFSKGLESFAGVESTYTTATRSISRSRDGHDTDSKTDWHIVPTNGITLGTENSDLVFQGS